MRGPSNPANVMSFCKDMYAHSKFHFNWPKIGQDMSSFPVWLLHCWFQLAVRDKWFQKSKIHIITFVKLVLITWSKFDENWTKFVVGEKILNLIICQVLALRPPTASADTIIIFLKANTATIFAISNKAWLSPQWSNEAKKKKGLPQNGVLRPYTKSGFDMPKCCWVMTSLPVSCPFSINSNGQILFVPVLGSPMIQPHIRITFLMVHDGGFRGIS